MHWFDTRRPSTPKQTLNSPAVSNDNPFSESQFKTLRYCPAFPQRFGSLHDARAFCQYFFTWYNREHHHSGLALLTPESVHYGLADEIIAERQAVLDRAFAAYPERFVKGRPQPLRPPATVWINPPAPATLEVTSCSPNCEVSVSRSC